MRAWLRGFSIRTRITVGTLVVALVVSAVGGILLRLEVAAIIHSSTVQLLHNDTAPFEARIKSDPGDPDVHAGEGQLVALIAPSGNTATSNLPDRLADRLAELRHQRGAPHEVGNGDTGYLTLVERVRTPRGTWEIIVARSLEPGNLVLDSLSATLIIGAFVLFVLFGLASWLLSGLALRPVSRMRLEAEKLGEADSDGSLLVGPARDELAELAATLNELLRRNRQSLDRERQMVADASHELRTPLAVLIAQLNEALQAARDDGPEKRMIESASATADRLSTLTTNLLELSKLDADRGTSSATFDELAYELSSSTDRARTVAQSRGVPVDFEITQSRHEVYAVSAPPFGRVVDNLFANAIAASEPGGPVIASMTQDGAGMALTVVDVGRGVPESFVPIAFDRFTRPDEARRVTGGGSGLGLAIVAAIAKRAGGTVTIENRHPGVAVAVSVPRLAPAR